MLWSILIGLGTTIAAFITGLFFGQSTITDMAPWKDELSGLALVAIMLVIPALTFIGRKPLPRRDIEYAASLQISALAVLSIVAIAAGWEPCFHCLLNLTQQH